MKKTTLLFFTLLLGFSVFAQNTCATAIPVTAGSYVVGPVNGTAPTIACASNGGATFGEWYSYTPTQNYTVTVTTDLAINSGGDTNFHVYSGTCAALVCVTGDDDSGNIGNGYLSIATFNVSAGTTYRIAFDNKWSATGFTFQLIENPLIIPVISFSGLVEATTGANNCVVDMNGDYRDDIVSVTGSNIQILQKNAGAGFTTINIPTASVTNTPSWSIAAGDFDKNGKTDLLYGGGNGVTMMKANAAGSSFTSINNPEYVFSQRSNFVDINKDGNLDAFVCHDVDPNVYFLNDGTGNLVFHQGGLGDHAEGGNYGSIWVDYDNDGDSDLFIAKCRGGATTANINELHQNNNGVFTNVAVAANMADPVQTWSSAWGDFDNDGDMDALVGASSNANGMHKLMRNNYPTLTFTDVTAGSGYDIFPDMGIEHVTHDFNNDGYLDVFGAGNKILINNGNMTFTPNTVTPTNGPIGDLNNDGFLDVQNGSTIYYNTGNANNWIKINLQGIQSNRNGIGARVEIYGAWGKQIRDVRSGDGFRYMSTLNAHFGIGTATGITQVIVRWPSGIVDTVINPTINQPLLVIEGATLGVNEYNNTSFSVYPNPAKDILNINLKTINSIQLVQIYDINGKLVLEPKANDNTINVQSLNRGTYILMLRDENDKDYSQKIIKE